MPNPQRHRAKRRLSSYAGLEELGRLFNAVPLDAALDNDSFKSIVGLAALGKDDFGEIERFKTNRYFQDALQLSAVPGADTLRQWLAAAGPVCETMAQWSRRLLDARRIPIGSVVELEKLPVPGSGSTVLAACAGDARWVLGVALLPRAPSASDVETFLKRVGAGPERRESSSSELASDLDLDRPSLGSFALDEAMLHVRMVSYNCLRLIVPGLAARRSGQPTIWNEDVHEYFNENGYAIMPGVLSDDEVEEIRAILLRLAAWEREHGTAFLYGGGDTLQRIYNLLNKHPIFRDLIQRPLILEIMDDLFDRDTLHNKYLLCSWHANIIGGGGEAQILHVDSAVPEPLPPWIIRANINYLLDDYTEQNGATLCLPGSHKFLRKPTAADQKRTDLVTMTAPKGSLAIWTGHLWHKSGRNQTSKERMGLLGGFAASHLKEMCIEEDHLQIIDKDIVKNATPALQRMIGVGHGIKKGALQKPPEW
jgi:ectoine hydroxylase-related dioxygenase (phytanoyl-CoA dioxygenase family)